MKLKKDKLNKRQEIVMEIIDKSLKISNSGISLELSSYNIPRITLIRDLNHLINLGFIKRFGKARGVYYEVLPAYSLFKTIDIEKYFKEEVDQRSAFNNFNFNLLDYLTNIFTSEEKKYLNKLLIEYHQNINKLSKDILKHEFERLTIDFSWKSSVIEGNTYTLLETESLIKYGQKAKGHGKEEVAMILNHKKSLDYINSNLGNFKEINILKLDNIHTLLTKDLKIGQGLRKMPVGITGTIYRPLDNLDQIKEYLGKTCNLVNREKGIFSKSIILMLLIAYIQPFVDGNKRTGRLSANAILMAYNICPLSYRNVDEAEFKKAIILFYEQNNISYFKELFIEQFEFAVKSYFRA